MVLNIAEVKRHLYPEEFDSYLQLKKMFEAKKFGKERITLFYPGCGTDIINVLLFFDVLLDWQKVKEINFVFVDTKEIAPMFISSTLDKIIPGKSTLDYVSGSKAEIKFTLNNCKVTLMYFLANAIENLPKVLYDGFDIYFERAFELFRADEEWFITFVLEHAKDLLVSDCGFCSKDLLRKHGFVGFGPDKLPAELGFYNNLKIYKKRKN